MAKILFNDNLLEYCTVIACPHDIEIIGNKDNQIELLKAMYHGYIKQADANKDDIVPVSALFNHVLYILQNAPDFEDTERSL